MKKIFLSISPLIIFAITWECIVKFNLMPGNYVLPSFSDTVKEYYNLLKNGVLLKNLFSSLYRVVIGLALGSISGILIGIVMGLNKSLNLFFSPIVAIIFPIPALGWLPFFMIWFGIGDILPIAVIFMCSFFPLIYTTVTGIESVDKNYINVAKTFGASKIEILKTIILPLALPNIFTGLRLEAGMAWRVIVAAEMVAIPSGIGALLMKAESLMRMDIIIACLVTLSIMCLAFEYFFKKIEYYFTKWRFI